MVQTVSDFLFVLGEEMPVLPWLTAEVLVGCGHMVSKMSGCVPGPPGIVENRSRYRHQVGISCSDNCFGLLKFGDQPHRYNGNSDRTFDRSSEWDLVVGADRDVLIVGKASA